MFESFQNEDRDSDVSLASWATYFAVTLLVSFGLCGVTAGASALLHAGISFMVVGFLELLGMTVGLAGLFAVGLFALFRWLMGLRSA